MVSTRQKIGGKLLSDNERKLCSQLQSGESTETGQRATALLLLDDGATQVEAAEHSKLSVGQIRYLTKRFREKGMTIFPPEVLSDCEQVISSSADEPRLVDDLSDSSSGETVTHISPAAKKTQKQKKPNKKRVKRPKPPRKKKKSRRKRKKNK